MWRYRGGKGSCAYRDLRGARRPDGLGKKAHIEITSGEIVAAREAADTALSLDPRNAFAWSKEAQIESSLGNLSAAREALVNQLSYAPNSVIAWVTKAQIEFSAGNVNAAREAIEKVAALGPNHPVRWGLAAKLAIADGDQDALNIALTQLRTVDPDSRIALLYEGRMAIHRNDWATTERIAIQLMKTFHPSHIFFVRCLVVFGKFDGRLYEAILANLKRSGDIEQQDTHFDLGPSADEDAVAQLDHPLFAKESIQVFASRSVIFTTSLIPTPIDRGATNVASNGNRGLWARNIKNKTNKNFGKLE